MSEKHEICVGLKITCNIFLFIFLFVSAVIGGVSVSASASLAGVPEGITSSGVGLKICILTAGIKKYKWIIKKKRKKHGNTVLLAKRLVY